MSVHWVDWQGGLVEGNDAHPSMGVSAPGQGRPALDAVEFNRSPFIVNLGTHAGMHPVVRSLPGRGHSASQSPGIDDCREDPAH